MSTLAGGGEGREQVHDLWNQTMPTRVCVLFGISVDAKGTLYLNTVPTDLARLQEGLIEMRKADPDLSVIIRGDSTIRYQHVSAVLDVLQQVNVVKVSLATDPANAGGSGK